MSSSRPHRRRILRGGDGVEALSASLLVNVPAGAAVPAGAGPGLNEMLENARREGFDEGYRAATAEAAAGEAAGRMAQLRRMADALSDAATEVRESRHTAVTLGAAEAAGLAYDLAAAFLQRELTVGRPVVEAVVRALALVPEEQDLVVRLNPDDSISLEELAELVPDAAVKILADPRVETGGCVIQAGPCRIDTQLGAALDRVRHILVEAYPELAPEQPLLEAVGEVA